MRFSHPRRGAPSAPARAPAFARRASLPRKRGPPVPNQIVVLYPAFCFLVLGGFLGCLGLFALAVTKVVAPDGKGHARTFAGGCAAVLALFLLCTLGVAGLGATVVAIGVGSVSEWNPIRRIEIQREHPAHASARTDDRKDGEAERGAISARFTVRGEAGGELVSLLHDLVDVDLGELGDGLTVHQQTAADGSEFSVYEFRLPISERELERFEHDVKQGLNGLKLHLPESVDIEFDGAEQVK